MTSGPDDQRVDSVNLEISRMHTRLLHEYTGRGPQQARTTIQGNLVVCLLADTLSKGERTLVDRGLVSSVLDMRRQLQDAMQHDLTAEVERLTSRKVVAFMSTNHLDPDYAAEVYVLDQAVTTAADTATH